MYRKWQFGDIKTGEIDWGLQPQIFLIFNGFFSSSVMGLKLQLQIFLIFNGFFYSSVMCLIVTWGQLGSDCISKSVIFESTVIYYGTFCFCCKETYGFCGSTCWLKATIFACWKVRLLWVDSVWFIHCPLSSLLHGSRIRGKIYKPFFCPFLSPRAQAFPICFRPVS